MERGKMLIAVFEDNPVDRFLYQRNLKLFGDKIDFIIFDTPEKGLEMARNVKFDIVVINIHFWGSHHGTKILKQLQKIYSSSFPSIAVTPLLQAGDVHKILTEGFTVCVENPSVFKQIHAMLSDKH